ncbi:MAG: Uncharacterized protein Greene07144_1144 [Parcubacteria group bacterium Greene0714_4]|nr:MAG: Uncharacterized protein Greene101415_1168 [Parcubacteria group bacterium Greene1014_15]TSD06595.1 MAG: Uncharacterized protein Greene07144_1144 [Parcubacteria group bacterium Greene0714_4]
MKNKKGFTLLEILLVVAAIGILASIVIVAINPGKQLGDTRNTQRQADVNTILNAVYQFAIDNNGTLPVAITTTATEICIAGTLIATCTGAGLIPLNELVLLEKYLISIPIEPQKTSVNGVGYLINKTANGRITVQAQFEEQGKVISVTR